MDWLTFKLCVLIWVISVSKSKSQSKSLNSTSSLSEQDCVNGVDLPQPDACNKCICRRGKVTCSNMICIPAHNCAEKQLYHAQNKCNACICVNGFIKCTSNPCAEEPLSSTIPTRPECVPGQHIPQPDDCNNCICFEGQIHCTHLPCRMDSRKGPECTDDQAVIRPDECNECYCFEGRLECITDLVCIRGSTCVQGQVIPKPDSCNACKCVEGHILCTNYQCLMPNTRNARRPERPSTEVRTLDECQEGDVIPPPPAPKDCNTCYCMDSRILCTINICEGSDSEIKGRLREPNEQNDLEIFDKKISVAPFINMLSKNHEKLPTQLIHPHAYNGFHQEIKVHATHLPKDVTKLFKVLATSLDNSALASISQKLLTSPNSLSNDHNSEIPLDHQVVQIKLLGEGNLLNTQSSKLITAGSQSNETILVIPNTEPFDDSLAVLPLTSKHESIWKSVSSPASLVFNNNQQTKPPSCQEEKLNVFYFGNPPRMFTSIDQINMIRNPSKFSRPGLPHMLPTKTTRNTVQIPNTNIESIYPASKHKLININDGKMSYGPFSQENKQFKSTPFDFVSNRDDLPSHLRPYQLIKPGHTQVFNYTSSTPIFTPGKFIVTPINIGGQQKPSLSQFIPNLSNYYTNHVKPQQIQFKPNQNHLLTLNNKGIQHPPLFPNNPNQPIVATKQYKKPQTQPRFGLKPGQVSVSPLNNNGYQTDQQFNAFPPRFQINLPLINLPNQNKRISSIPNEGSNEIPPHSMVPNSTAHQIHILNPTQIGVDLEHTQHKSSHSQFVPNPSIDYRNEYEAPKIIEVNPDQEPLIPHSNISYTHTEYYNPPHTSINHHKIRKYNTTHPHYEKYTTITYVSEYDPTHPGNPLQIVHDPNRYQNASQTNVYENYLPDQESQDLDLIMSKVNYNLNLPNLQLDQNEPDAKLTSQTSFFPGHRQNYTLQVNPTVTDINKYKQLDSWNITNYQFDKYPHSPNDGKNEDPIKSYQNRITPTNPMYHTFTNYPHSPSQSQFILSQLNSNKGGLNDPESAEGFQSQSEDATHPKSNEHLPPSSQTRPTQSQHAPGVFDDRGSTYGFQYANYAYEDPRKLKPVYTLSKMETPQNQQLPGFFDERGSANGFQYPSNSAEDLTHPKTILNKSPDFDYTSIFNPEQPKDNLHISPHSQFGPAQNQHKPGGGFDNRGNKDGFQCAHNVDENPTHLKPLQKLLYFTHSRTPFGPTLIQHSPGMFEDRTSADGFQYPYNSAENTIHSRGLHNPERIQFGPTQNQNLPGKFYERGSADGFHYPSNSAENTLHPKDKLYKLLQIQFSPKQNQQLPGVFDERGSADGFQYTSLAENPAHLKENMHKSSSSPFGSTAYKQLPGTFNGHGSPDGFQYSSDLTINPLHLKHNLHILPHHTFVPTQNQHKQTIYKHPNFPIDPTQNQHLPGMFDERGSSDGFKYPSNSIENPTHPKNNPNTTPESKFTQPQNQPKPSVDDGDNNNNPLRPWMHLDHDQYKPSFFDNLINAVHNIPWSFSGDHNKDSETFSSAPKPRLTTGYDQYKPSSFNNLLKIIHQIPWSVPNQDNNVLGSDAEMTTARSGFKPKQDQYELSMVNNPFISNQNEYTDLTDEDDNQLQIEQDVSTPSTDITDSDSTQYKLLSKLKPDSDPDTLLPTDDGKIPDYYDQLYPLFKVVKKLSDPPIDDSLFSVGSMNHLVPFLFPGIAKILNYEPLQGQNDVSPVENHEVQRINPLSKLKSKLNQFLPENDDGILNWLKSKLNKLVPTKDKATVTKNNIDMAKIFNLISKLTPPKLKHSTALQNISLSGFDSEIIENIMNDFKEDTLTTSSTPRTDSTHSYENRFKSDLTILEESRLQAPQLKYPDVHIILQQSNAEDDVEYPQYIETDGERNLAIDIDSEEISASNFPKMFNPRFRYRPKDQKEECGDGTQWISNCHGCSCDFGQAMCFRLPDCELRSLGEPMTCKPYSHFKMGCYTCECNGDGVAECDATDCDTQPSGKSRVSGSTKSPLPVFNEFVDNKNTNEILQYYNFYKKLPKDCSKQDLRKEYPTCERGTNWVSSCHKCVCNESGKHECTKIDDCKLDVDLYGKPGRCKPNSKFYPKKNSMPCVECSCNDEGIPHCPAADYREH